VQVETRSKFAKLFEKNNFSTKEKTLKIRKPPLWQITIYAYK